MMKKIIITAGPTNERIDSVMKITNMATGKLGTIIADTMIDKMNDEIEKIYYITTKMSYKPKVKSSKIEMILIESTEDLLRTLLNLFEKDTIDAIIHSAAVGDYFGEYCITGEELANQIIKVINNKELSKEEMKSKILDIIEHPSESTDNSGKMSSYQKNLIVKLGLTPKVIGKVKEVSPKTKLIGFKLLDGVTEEELLSVASRLMEKNSADVIVANDLSKIGDGKHPAIVMDKDKNKIYCQTKEDIAIAICKKIF